MFKTLEQACTPRRSVFDPTIGDTVYNIDDLNHINAERFFAENYVTESYAQSLPPDQRETELRMRLQEMYAPKLKACYGQVQALPAPDQVQPAAESTTLVICRPSPLARQEIEAFYDHAQYKNRLLFLTGDSATYERVLERSAYLRAIGLIIDELQRAGIRENDPQMIDAKALQTREQSSFYQACREAFRQLLYPSKNGLTDLPLEPQYAGNNFDGERAIVEALTEAYKYEPNATANNSSFVDRIISKLWSSAKEIPWNEVKTRAATDPSWVWHHPRALDDVRSELISRDQWRDIGNLQGVEDTARWLDRGCIIFSQYYDSARWVAHRLSARLPDEPVGVYANVAGSGLYRDGLFTPMTRESLKDAVGQGTVRLLVGTDAASEGLNLQAIGTLINLDLPWNPTRLEQRKGRIQRIGQRRDEVYIYNMRYRDSVEDRVHQLLSSRLHAIRDMFGQLPDTLEDVWVSAALHDEERARQIIDEVPPTHPFALRYDRVEPVDWESCSIVLHSRSQLEALLEGW